jgi:hypothetical protein
MFSPQNSTYKEKHSGSGLFHWIFWHQVSSIFLQMTKFHSLNTSTFSFLIFQYLYYHILVIQGTSLWYFHIYLQCTLVRIPTNILSHPTPPTENYFNRLHCFIFIK